MFLSTDYPGSPNLPADIAKLPIYTSYGNTLGLTQDFNHLELSAKASYDRTKYQDSKLTDGETSSNHDRDYTQYGGAVRASYEVFPGVRPFVEVGADTRKHDLQFDRNGYQRDSQAITPKVGSTFEITRKLTGEVSVGYLMRHYQDPNSAGPARRGLRRLAEMGGDRPDHGDADRHLARRGIGGRRLVRRAAARRRRAGRSRAAALADLDGEGGLWLRRIRQRPCTCTGGEERQDKRMSLGTALTYKFNREFSLKGEYRYDQLHSNAAGANYNANVFLVGLKLQR